MQRVERHRSHAGWQEVYTHDSAALGCAMRFAIYLPPQAESRACPVLYWLSGLTCTEQNFVTKAHAQAHAAQHGIIVVAPDTSPRGAQVPDDASYDLGQGAGFYVDATEAPWSTHYRMHEYVARELPALIEREFPATAARAISGHSMGGHGALVVALRNPGRYASVSAFAPIVAPSRVPWGEKALTFYLGRHRAAWRAHDAVALIEDGARTSEILVDQGGADSFLERELKPELLEQACRAAGIHLTLRMQPGYDHSYYFISTFMEDHLRWHFERLA
jgi:S-formylglutathione hydrolase